jgi:hypothetical protein
VEYILENNGPAYPRTPRIKQWLDSILDTIVEFDPTLDVFADMSPGKRYEIPYDHRNNIDYHG